MKFYLIFIFFLFLILPVFSINDNNKIASLEDTVVVKNYLKLSESADDLSKKDSLIKKGLVLSKKIDWREGIGLSYYYLAWIYFFSQKSDFAIDFFSKAVEYSSNKSIKVNSLGIISNIYSWNKNHQKAQEYATKAMDVIYPTDAGEDFYIEAFVYQGDVYRYNGNKKKEEEFYLKAFKLTDIKKKEIGYQMNRLYVYMYISQAPINNPSNVLILAGYLMSQWEKATTLQKYKYTASFLKVLAAYTTTMESQRIKELKLDSEQKQKKIYILGIVVLFVLMSLLIWQNRSRKKIINELAQANDIKSRFFGILNHDLRRPVAGLISYLQLKQFDSKAISPEEATNFEQKTILTSQNLLRNMEELLFWCKGQMQSFEPEFTPVSVSKLFEDTKDFFSFEGNHNIVFNDTKNLKIETDENYLKTIMRNLTSNALSATAKLNNPNILWNGSVNKYKIILSITNNGGEISQDKINVILGKQHMPSPKDGLGLTIVRDLATAINCEIKVTTDKENNSTTFYLYFSS